MVWHCHAAAVDAALWQRLFSPPAEGLFWYRAIEAGCVDPREFSYGILECAGIPIAVITAFAFDMPLDVVFPPGAGHALPRALARICGIRKLRVFFVGNVAGEEGHVGLDQGVCLQSVALALHDGARARATALGARLVVWKDMDSVDAASLADLTVQRRAFRVPSYPGTRIYLLPGGYASFLQAQSSARRHKIRRKLSLGEKVLPVHTRMVTEPTRAELNNLYALFGQTYARGNVKFENLSPMFFFEIARAPEAHFIVMETHETHDPVAFMLLLRIGDRVINRFVGFDYSRGAHAYLPFRLFVAAYDWAAAIGAQTLHSGQTGYSAKLDLGHELVPLYNYCEHRSRLINAVLRWAARSTSWASLDPALADFVRAHPARDQRLRSSGLDSSLDSDVRDRHIARQTFGDVAQPGERRKWNALLQQIFRQRILGEDVLGSQGGAYVGQAISNVDRPIAAIV